MSAGEARSSKFTMSLWRARRFLCGVNLIVDVERGAWREGA